jgi:16S rRNA (guanine966-N2)-methyltransferase
LRVISGKLRGKRLFSIRGRSLRPTSDRVRESIFDILQGSMEEVKVLDLFAGTGAMGIETLSRGGNFAVFVENSPESLDALQRNIAQCRLQGVSEVLKMEAGKGIRFLAGRGEIFGLIFLDPPYGRGLVSPTLKAIEESSILTPETWIVAEHSPEEEIEGVLDLKRMDHRKYGGTRVSFFRKAVRNSNQAQTRAGLEDREEE